MSTSDTPDVLPQGMRFHAGDLGDAYVAGATSARRHHPASDELVSRSCDAYVKHAHLVRLDPMSDTPAVPVSRPVDLEAWERLARAVLDAKELEKEHEDEAIGPGYADCVRATRAAQDALARFSTSERILGLIGQARAAFTAEDVYAVYAVGCWDGGNVNRPKPGEEERAAEVVGRVFRMRAARRTEVNSAAPEERDDA